MLAPWTQVRRMWWYQQGRRRDWMHREVVLSSLLVPTDPLTSMYHCCPRLQHLFGASSRRLSQQRWSSSSTEEPFTVTAHRCEDCTLIGKANEAKWLSVSEAWGEIMEHQFYHTELMLIIHRFLNDRKGDSKTKIYNMKLKTRTEMWTHGKWHDSREIGKSEGKYGENRVILLKVLWRVHCWLKHHEYYHVRNLTSGRIPVIPHLDFRPVFQALNQKLRGFPWQSEWCAKQGVCI